jgi:Protein of unknown function DUF262/Protein of unknown function (DUF1524)
MEASERTISQILTEQIRYEIPPYQRPYSWERGNVEQLLDDVWESYEAGEAEYFIGSLITIERDKGALYEVVDGQQRLTTLNLIFARLRDHIQDADAKGELAKRVLPRNSLTGEEKTPRLTLRKKDQAFFRRHVLAADPVTQELLKDLEQREDAPKLRLVENLEAIDAFCGDKDQQTLKLFANFLLSRVYVVFVTTNSWQSAYRLFNVLNARGMALSNADLIKNALFARLGGAGDRSEELEERWLELEDTIGIERMDQFLSRHRTSIVALKARGALHEEFEPLVKASPNPFGFLDAVTASAKNYMRIQDGAFDDAGAIRALRSLQRVAFEEWVPPLLAFLNRPVEGMTAGEFIALLEKITFQNWIRRLAFTARLTVYFQLINAIKAGRSAGEITAIFRANAQDAEFETLLDGEVYNKPFAQAVLLRLEEADQDDSVTKSYGGQITIEHVLPQALKDDYWKDRFTDEEHRLWLHRLGTLALLAGIKNYKAQYFSFDRKKGFYAEKNKKVSFDTTKQILSEPEWRSEQIEARQRALMESAVRIWR